MIVVLCSIRQISLELGNVLLTVASTAACLSNCAFCDLAAILPHSEPLSISNSLLNVTIFFFFTLSPPFLPAIFI